MGGVMGGLDTIIFDPRPPPSLLNFFLDLLV